jgi:rifampin ADP-ribosylating transferase
MKNVFDAGPFYHGTKAELRIGDLLVAGHRSNFKSEIVMNHIYFSARLDIAGLAADIAPGDDGGHVYVVEPTGDFEDDPNVTDKKFPGNPTRSYRSRDPLRIVKEIAEWPRLSKEELRRWREWISKNDGEILN